MPARRLSEPSWHRNRRRDRCKARFRLQEPESLTTSQLKLDTKRLRFHHGSRIPKAAMAMLDRTGSRTKKWAEEADQCQLVNNSQWTERYLPNVGVGNYVGPSGHAKTRHWSPEQEAQARVNASRTPVPRRLSPQDSNSGIPGTLGDDPLQSRSSVPFMQY